VGPSAAIGKRNGGLESPLYYWHMTVEFERRMTTATFDTARRAMVLSQLRPQGVTDPAVLAAMATVERENYLPDHLAPMAYSDRALRLADGSPVLSPTDLGLLLNEIQPRPGERALVVGKGGAYTAAVLEAMGLEVARATDSDVRAGSYDVIVVEGALTGTPAELASRLAPGGRLGIPLAVRGIVRLCIGMVDDTVGGRQLALRSFADGQVSTIPGADRPPAFTF
jgi:protein-L-isoaspartate(D-aspartate) O-methyltransferase